MAESRQLDAPNDGVVQSELVRRLNSAGVRRCPEHSSHAGCEQSHPEDFAALFTMVRDEHVPSGLGR